MSTRETCPEPEELSLWIEGGGDPAFRARTESHLASCEECRRAWADVAEGIPDVPVSAGAVARIAAAAAGEASGAMRVSRVPRWAAWSAAAAVLAAVSLPFSGIFPSRPAGPTRAIPAGEPVSGRTETFRTGPGDAPRIVEAPDGTRLRIHPSTRLRFEPAPGGERLRAVLERGFVEADVVKGASQVWIASPAGDIVVVGTRFAVRAFRIHGKDGALPVVSVEVSEGTVELVRGPKRLSVTAGRRAIAWTGAAPLLQETRSQADWRETAGRWQGAWPVPPATPALLMGSGQDGIADWWELLGSADAPVAWRRSAARLVAVSAEPDDAPRLLRAFAEEDDEAVRCILLPDLARIVRAAEGDAAAVMFLGGILEGGAAGKVREAAAALLGEIAE